MILALDDGRAVSHLLATPFGESDGAVSPDGRWIAYQSNASGRVEVYVQPFPNFEDGRWQISTDGGASPAWGPFGDELFYWSPDALMAVPVRMSPSFEPGRPGRLFNSQGYVTTGPDVPGRQYDIAPDRQRFLIIKDADPGDEDQSLAGIQVVLNWDQELLERVPVP